MDENGALHQEKMAEALSTDNDRSKIDELLGKCGSVKGANDCETAFKIYECYKTNSNSNI